MVPHAGSDGAGGRIHSSSGGELPRSPNCRCAQGEPTSPCVFDWENWWAFDGNDHPSQLLDLIQLVLDWYRQLYQANVAVEFAHPNADLGDYRLVVAPNLYLLSDDSLAALQAFASNGSVSRSAASAVSSTSGTTFARAT